MSKRALLAVLLSLLLQGGCGRAETAITPAVPTPTVAVPLAAAQPTPTATPTVLQHTVQAGDTLSALALRYGTTVEEIAAANNLSAAGFLPIGQTLRISRVGELVVTPTATATPSPLGEAITYTIQPGDTLYSIALRYGTTVARLAAANNLADPDSIRLGQTLRIPSVAGVVPTPTATPTPLPASPEPTPPSATATPTTVPLTPTLTPTPISAPPPAAGLGYGMQVDIGNDLNRALGLLTAAGFGWIKFQVRWADYEPERGNIRWGDVDLVVNAAQARGIKVLFSVVTAPRWSRPGDTDFNVDGPPANPQDYANFVGAIANRHKGKVHAYEIWNEQNLWYEWGGQGNRLNAVRYLELLRVAYQTLKATDPGAVVVSGALTPTGINDGNLAYDDQNYLRMMYQAGLKSYSDAIGAHPSGYNNPPDADWRAYQDPTATFGAKGHRSWFFKGTMEAYRDVMLEFGDGDKQLWFTEFGWAVSITPPAGYEYARDNTEQEQATWLRQAYEIAAQKGYVGLMSVWNLNFFDTAVGKRAFAILRPDWSPRPAYCTLAAMRGRTPTGC